MARPCGGLGRLCLGFHVLSRAEDQGGELPRDVTCQMDALRLLKLRKHGLFGGPLSRQRAPGALHDLGDNVRLLSRIGNVVPAPVVAHTWKRSPSVVTSFISLWFFFTTGHVLKLCGITAAELSLFLGNSDFDTRRWRACNLPDTLQANRDIFSMIKQRNRKFAIVTIPDGSLGFPTISDFAGFWSSAPLILLLALALLMAVKEGATRRLNRSQRYSGQAEDRVPLSMAKGTRRRSPSSTRTSSQGKPSGRSSSIGLRRIS